MKATPKDMPDTSFSLFSYIFSELITYLDATEDSKSLQEKLNEVGFFAGEKILEHLASNKESRFDSVKSVLMFIFKEVWIQLFGEKADDIDKSLEDDDEYRIYDSKAIINKYLSTKLEQVNCGGFVAGIIQGILYATDFPAKVDSSMIEDMVGDKKVRKVVYIIKFAKHVIKENQQTNS